MQRAPLVGQRTKQQIAADAAHERRIHHAQIQFRHPRAGRLRLIRAGADDFRLRLIEGDLRPHRIRTDEIQTAQTRRAAVQPQRHDVQIHPHESDVRGQQRQRGRGQMHGGGQHVVAVQDVFHDGPVQRLQIHRRQAAPGVGPRQNVGV